MDQETSEGRISRRQLLKIATAMGGSLAASTLLPGKWISPKMATGVLPVHAQSSQPVGPQYTITGSTEDVAWADGSYGGTLIVTINPPAAGILMKADYEFILQNTSHAQASTTLTASTDGSGTAQFDTIHYTGVASELRVTYTFGNPAQCTTGCTRVVTKSVILG